MIMDELKELGFSENEAKVYVSLLQLGRCTTGPIIRKSGLYRVMVYDTLEKLVKLGLVKYSLQKNRKNFEAEDPRHIVEMIKNKEMVARSVADQLAKMKREIPLEEGAFVYEGWNGIKTAQENYFKEMKRGDGEYLMVGASRQLHKKLDSFFNTFHERRSSVGVPAKLLFNENNRPFGRAKKRYAPVQVRFMPKNIVTPSWISTYKDMTLIGVADEPMAFLIRNTAVADSYRQYFYFMWEKSRP